MDEHARQDFADFAAARSPELLRLAYVLTGDRYTAEDLLQTALTRAAAHWGRVQRSPEAYLRKIMYREQVSQWRRRSRRPETVMAEPPEPAARDQRAGDQLASADSRLALREALLALPPGKRVVLVLRYLEDMPEAQVAAVLGCSVGTVRSQTYKAIRQLKSVLPNLGLSDVEVPA